LQCEIMKNKPVWHDVGEVRPGPLLPLGHYRLDFPENPPYRELYSRAD
jgi:hypothetical protein